MRRFLSNYFDFLLTCKFDTSRKTLGQQYNYGKGDYENLCKFIDIDWEPYLRQCSSTDTKWLLFKNRLAEGIEKFVPKISLSFTNGGSHPGNVLYL